MKVWIAVMCVGPLFCCSANGGASSAEIAAAESGGAALAAGSGGAAGMASDAGGLAGAAGSSGAAVVDAGAAGSGGTAGAAESGGAGSDADAGATAIPATPGTFTSVLAILNAHGCSACHGAPPGEGDGGLSFFTSQRDNTYTALVGVQSVASSRTVCAGKTYVVPGSPEMSLLYDKVANATPSCGGRMPASGMPLSAAELDSLSTWISMGAKED